MSNPIVYMDSPLGDYLEGNFLPVYAILANGLGTGTYDGDWGLSSDQESVEDGGNEAAHHQVQRDFAPPSRLPNRKFTTRELKPLIIGNENVTRTAKFYSLFTVRTLECNVVDH